MSSGDKRVTFRSDVLGSFLVETADRDNSTVKAGTPMTVPAADVAIYGFGKSRPRRPTAGSRSARSSTSPAGLDVEAEPAGVPAPI